MKDRKALWKTDSMREPGIKNGDRIIWCQRTGTVMDIDTSAQKTKIGRANGWPFAAWVLFDDTKNKDDWSCVNAFECRRI